MTTVEVDEVTLKRLKEARDTIQKKFNIKIRMLDMMGHLVTTPEDIVETVSRSINQRNKQIDIRQK
jgi:hypothetical protein